MRVAQSTDHLEGERPPALGFIDDLASVPMTAVRRVVGDDLVAGVRAGEHVALAALYERYRPELARYARRRLRASDAAAVDDVIQDVFVSALQALPGDDRLIALRPWLYRVTHNRCVDELKQATFESLAPELVDPADHGARWDSRERLTAVVEGIKGLPPRQRRAMVLRELCGLGYDAIADELQTTVPAVKSLLVRARRAL